MKYVEIRGKADLRLIGLSLAHGIKMTRKCIVVTDDTAFARVGTAVTDRIYLCDQVYAVILPELFAIKEEKNLVEMLELAAKMVQDETGDTIEDIVLCWMGGIKTSLGVRVDISLYKTGMKNDTSDEYQWKKEEHTGDAESLHYIIFYDKVAHKKVSYDGAEKVLVTDAEMVSIRRMEQTGQFKITAGGYFNIANDIAIKKCGVFEGALKEQIKK